MASFLRSTLGQRGPVFFRAMRLHSFEVEIDQLVQRSCSRSRSRSRLSSNAVPADG